MLHHSLLSAECGRSDVIVYPLHRRTYDFLLFYLSGQRIIHLTEDKEQWEPTIQRLFHAQQCKDEVYRIREVWSFDRQNHGDAAILNREALKDRPKGVCGFTSCLAWRADY
jgi:hypothetical protein